MKEICSINICTGCSACANACPNNCISMSTGKEGFIYPNIDTYACVDCGLCKKVCPVNSFHNDSINETPVAYAAYNKDSDTVNSSSSGGVFSALAEYVISRGGVVYGAALCDDFSVSHIKVDSVEDISLLQGSKYAQSNLGDIYSRVKKDLCSEVEVLFSGTPCQVAALKSFLNKPYDNLLCVDIICHSVPSPKVWKEYLRQTEEGLGSKVTGVNFRDKRDSWQNYCLSIKAENNSEVVRKSENNIYMKAFIGGLSTRESCYSCKFKGQNRASDITLGDFWGCMSVCSEFVNDRGTSLVLIQTNKGQAALSKINNKLVALQVDAKDALVHNPAYYYPAVAHRNREEFFNSFTAEPFEELVERLSVPTNKDKIKQKIHRSIIYRACKRVFRLLHG